MQSGPVQLPPDLRLEDAHRLAACRADMIYLNGVTDSA
jgi:hypothetical protein